MLTQDFPWKKPRMFVSGMSVISIISMCYPYYYLWYVPLIMPSENLLPDSNVGIIVSMTSYVTSPENIRMGVLELYILTDIDGSFLTSRDREARG